MAYVEFSGLVCPLTNRQIDIFVLIGQKNLNFLNLLRQINWNHIPMYLWIAFIKLAQNFPIRHCKFLFLISWFSSIFFLKPPNKIKWNFCVTLWEVLWIFFLYFVLFGKLTWLLYLILVSDWSKYLKKITL